MKKLLFILTMLTASLAANAGEFKTVFIYGLAMSFNDSTVYLTDIQRIDSVWIEKNGFLLCHWDGTQETEERIKEETKATIRCIPFDAPEEEGKCIYSGKPSHRRVVFARSY